MHRSGSPTRGACTINMKGEMIKIRLFITIAMMVFSLNVGNNAFGCSAFLVKDKDHCIIGFNENWKTMPGMVVINKRGVVKKNLSWNHLVTANTTSEPELEWTSKYGSVSFNLLGFDLPCYGLNEKGLFIVELFLDKTFSLPDSLKPKMFWAHWIQYQLDNYSTVDEVINGLKHTPVIDWWPTFPGSHFYVSDKKGNTAAIELIDGKFHVSSGKTMPVPVLCNDKYQEELTRMKRFKPFGGNETLDLASINWDNRFSKAACYIKNYNPSNDTNVILYAFNVLDRLIAGQWQTVVDVKNNIIYFRSDQGKSIKSLNLSHCDFSKNASTKFIDINSDRQGDVFSCLSNLTVDINDDYVAKGFPVGYENQSFYNSDEYTCLKRKLHAYASEKLK